MTRREFLDKHFDRIKKLYPGTKVVYGPYLNKKDGRHRVCIYDGKHRLTKQYCRLKMEVKLKRVLTDDETVDHDNGDVKDDKYSNLVIRARLDHVNLDIKRREHSFDSICKWCNEKFKPTVRQVREKRKNKEKAGPFCSRSCSGKYGAYIQGGGDPLDRQKFPVIYYTNKNNKKK